MCVCACVSEWNVWHVARCGVAKSRGYVAGKQLNISAGGATYRTRIAAQTEAGEAQAQQRQHPQTADVDGSGGGASLLHLPRHFRFLLFYFDLYLC